jgi:ribonuclease E
VCGGHGLVRTTESAALAVLRKIHARVPRGDLSAVKVDLPPEVAIYLLNNKREDLAGLERRYKTRISVVPSPGMRPHQSEIELITKEGEPGRLEEPKAVPLPPERREERHDRHRREPEPPQAAESTSTHPPPPSQASAAEAPTAAIPATGQETGEVRRRRRRRRRRSRHGRKPGEATSPAAAGEAAPEEVSAFPEPGEAPYPGPDTPPEPGPLPEPSVPPETPPEFSQAPESSPEGEKPMQKVRRLWWRKRSGRSRSSGGGPSGPEGETSS